MRLGRAGWWLDMVILKVFSNLDDYMILDFYSITLSHLKHFFSIKSQNFTLLLIVVLYLVLVDRTRAFQVWKCPCCSRVERNEITSKIGRIEEVRVIQQNKMLLGLNFTVRRKPPDEIHARELGTEVWPGPEYRCESASDSWQPGEYNPSSSIT